MSTLQSILDLIFQAMSVEFQVFGFTISLWSFFVFSVILSVLAWFINKFFGGDE